MGAFLAGVAAVLLLGYYARTGMGTWNDVAVIGLTALVVMAIVAVLVRLGARVLAGIPPWFLGFSLAAVVAWLVASELPAQFALVFAVPIVVLAAIIGGTLAALSGRGWTEATAAKRSALAVVLVVSVAICAAFGWWLFWPGTAATATATSTIDSDLALQSDATSLPGDPSARGDHPVATLTYGSGDDRRRKEFGDDAVLKTDRVDATPFLKMNGIQRRSREWYWNFGADELPVNGRVWYPQGDGPFPLVLVVHGNDNMTEPADAGYGYLCELLASRGYIAVSVDETFFGSYFGTGGLRGENDARGWLLLKHLEVWREWNDGNDGPFAGKVDLERIALVGHSRGGEAVAHAAALNRLPYYPDDATVELGLDFGIQAIAAIAPSDRQYEPAGKPLELENISYLLLQGAADADVSMFLGLSQYERISFAGDGPWFKAMLYVDRANHGQFNTVWGRYDLAHPPAYLLNTRRVMDADEQRQIAEVTICAFLDATLGSDETLRALFRDHRLAGAYLPTTRYLTRYRDARFQTIADFEEDIDVTTATLPRASIQSHGLTTWRQGDLKLRHGGSQRNQVTWVGWGDDAEDGNGEQAAETSNAEANRDGGDLQRSGDGNQDAPQHGSAYWEIEFGEAADELEINDESWLVFELMDAREDPDEEDLLDFSVEVEDQAGRRAAVPVSSIRPLLPPFETEFTKLSTLEHLSRSYAKARDSVLQTFELRLSRLTDANADFNASRPAVIRFRFDRSRQGTIVIDNIGIAVRE